MAASLGEPRTQSLETVPLIGTVSLSLSWALAAQGAARTRSMGIRRRIILQRRGQGDGDVAGVGAGDELAGRSA